MNERIYPSEQGRWRFAYILETIASARFGGANVATADGAVIFFASEFFDDAPSTFSSFQRRLLGETVLASSESIPDEFVPDETASDVSISPGE